MNETPRAGERLRIAINSDPTLCTPGETVTIVRVERTKGGVYLDVDGRRDLRRFFWEEQR